MALQDLTPSQILAITKAVPPRMKKAARALIKPGIHKVDFAIRLANGDIRVGEDYNQEAQTSMSWEKLALSLADRVSDQVLTAALKEMKAGDERKKQKDRVDELFEGLRTTTSVSCKGKVTGTPETELLDMVEAADTGTTYTLPAEDPAQVSA